MSTISISARRAAATAAVVAGLAGTALATPTYAGSGPGGDPAAAGTAERPRTTLTIKAPDCNGCSIELQQGLWKPDGGARVWDGPRRTVRHGSVTFSVPTRRTHGMSMLVRAPWEGALPAITTVVFRYGHEQPGDPVGLREARSKRRGSACWAGTTQEQVTIPLATHRVRVPGNAQRWVPGTIAYTSVTQDWMRPVRRVWHGVMGSQDVNICGVQVAATP